MKDIWTQDFYVNTYDADFNQKLKISTIFNFFQHSAANHATELGWGYDTLSALSATWMLIRIKIAIDFYPEMGSVITVTTWPKGSDNLVAVRDFTMTAGAGKIFCKGTSQWIIADVNTFRPQRLSRFDFSMPLNSGMIGLAEKPEKLDIDLADAVICAQRKANYSEIDINKHVNNARYVDWIMDCFEVDDFERSEISDIQINYLSQVLPGDKLTIKTKPVPETADLIHICGMNDAEDKKHFEARVKWRPRTL